MTGDGKSSSVGRLFCLLSFCCLSTFVNNKNIVFHGNANTNLCIFRSILHGNLSRNSNLAIKRQQKTPDITNIPRVLSSPTCEYIRTVECCIYIGKSHNCACVGIIAVDKQFIIVNKHRIQKCVDQSFPVGQSFMFKLRRRSNQNRT